MHAAAAAPASAVGSTRVRLLFICTLFVGCSLLLLWRLYGFQVRDVARYRDLASDERRAQIPIIPRRGSLLDTRGNPLAISVLYDSVYSNGQLVSDPGRAAALLSPILQMPVQEVRSRIDKANPRPVVLATRVPSAVGEQVRALKLAGVYLRPTPLRQYPEGSVAAQVLGFVGRDFTGLAGLEMSYDQEIGGTPGVIDTEIDTTGQEIALGRLVLTPPREGSDLVLTLDRFVQRTAERILDEAVTKNKATGGFILVMDPKSGDVLAAATNPTFSLTDEDIYKPETAELYKATIVANQYEPGSTMKVVTMASAIEDGLVNPNTVYTDTGQASVGGALIHNWNGAANGPITMTQVLIKSSNVATQWVGGLLGADRFYRHITDFGFGKPTGLRLPGEVSGTVRTNTTDGWTRVDLATNSYGQGIAVTPVQMLQAVASFANDGVLMRPRLVREVRGADGPRALEPEAVSRTVSPETARTLVRMMTEVGAQEAYNPYQVPGYRVALKTGTADTPTSLGYNTSRTFASTVALLPAESPRFAVLVRIDGPEALYGGVAAVPVLMQLAGEMFTYYGIPPSEPIPGPSPARGR